MELGRSLAAGSRRSSAESASLRPSSSVCVSMEVSIATAFAIIHGLNLMKKKLPLTFLTALTMLLWCPLTQSQQFDFIISGARVVDGTGAAWYYGDVGISGDRIAAIGEDRKSTRLNSSHRCISYAVFCLKKKNQYT